MLSIVVVDASAVDHAAIKAATNPGMQRAASVVSRAKPRPAAKQVAPRPAPAAPDYAHRREVLDYIDDLVAREHFDRAALLRVFADVRYNATAARLMTPASTTSVRRDWNVYRARFVEPVRLAAGFRFWDDNAALLAKAEAEFGVPAEIIVGILGVETVYGRNTGGFRVVDALTTLAFDYPRSPDRGPRIADRIADRIFGSAIARRSSASSSPTCC